MTQRRARGSRATDKQRALTPSERAKHRAEAETLYLSGLSLQAVCDELNAKHGTGYYRQQMHRWLGRRKATQTRAEITEARIEARSAALKAQLIEMDRRHLDGLRAVQERALSGVDSADLDFKDTRQAGETYLGALKAEREIRAPKGQARDDGQLIVQINLGDGQVQQATMPIIEQPTTRRRLGRTERQRRHDAKAAIAAPAILPEPVCPPDQSADAEETG